MSTRPVRCGRWNVNCPNSRGRVCKWRGVLIYTVPLRGGLSCTPSFDSLDSSFRFARCRTTSTVHYGTINDDVIAGNCSICRRSQGHAERRKFLNLINFSWLVLLPLKRNVQIYHRTLYWAALLGLRINRNTMIHIKYLFTPPLAPQLLNPFMEAKMKEERRISKL